MLPIDYFKIILAFLVAGVVAFAATPLARKFAYVVGAVDELAFPFPC